MLLALVLIGLAMAQPRSEWMDEFDPESAYLSIISLTKEDESSVNATQNEIPNEAETDNDENQPPPPPPSEPENDRRRPPGPPGPWPPRPRFEDRCGNWSTWQQAKCWWPDQPLDQLPPACSVIPAKAHWPEWMKKFVVAKAMEKYNMLMEEYKTRGAPPKCGRCSRSFECRMRNETSTRRDFCPSKQIRPMFNVDCDDNKACEVTQEKGGCPPPLFLGGGRRQRLQQMIKDENAEGFARELWSMQGNGNNRRQKRQAEQYFDGSAGFMPFNPQLDFPYETGRQGRREHNPGHGRRPFGPSEDFSQLSFPSSPFDDMGPFGSSNEFSRPPLGPGHRGPPRRGSFGPSRDFRRPPFPPGPPGPPSRGPFGPSDDFPLPPFRPVPFRPHPRRPFEPSSDFPMPPFRPGPPSPSGRAPFAHPGNFPSHAFDSGSFQPLERGPFGPSNDFPQPSFRPGPPGGEDRRIRPSENFPRSPFRSGPFGHQQRGPSRPSENFPPPNFNPRQASLEERVPFGPSDDFAPPPFRAGPRGAPLQSKRFFGPGMSYAPTFSMMWARPMSFPTDGPQRPLVGPPPHHQFLLDLFHGTTCASSGKKCLCCCGHFVPNVDTGDCEDLRQLLPGIERMVYKVVKPSQPPSPSEKSMRQTKEFFRKQIKSY